MYYSLGCHVLISYSWNLVLINCFMFLHLKDEIMIQFLGYFVLWVPVSSTGKISDGCIRDLGFNPRLYQKLISVLVWW